jgi:hypothetical protein
MGIIIPNIPQAWSQHIHNLHKHQVGLTKNKVVDSYSIQGKKKNRYHAMTKGMFGNNRLCGTT